MPILLFLCIFSLNGMDNGVYPYKQEHQAPVAAIALPNMARLASTFTFTPKEYQSLLESEILPMLSGALAGKVHAHVYLHDGKPVGFITYNIKNQWYRPLLPDEVGPKAMIHHLAVDSKFEHNGYGSLLVKHALADLKSKSVSRVDLWTTGGPRLEKFYYRLGFKCTQRTKMQEYRYTMRLQPHPALICARLALRALSIMK